MLKINNKATEELIASIESLSHDGRGLAHLQGKTVFIENALPNETVSFVYVKKHSKFDEARATEILNPAPERAQPSCVHFGICGGCSLQHLSVEAQLYFKQQLLMDHLQHIGGVVPENILPALRSPSLEYRTKARLGLRYVHKKGKLLLGFREKNSRYLADLQSCAILHPSIGKKFSAIQEAIANLEAYQQIPQIEVAVGDQATALIVRHLTELNPNDLQKLETFGQKENFYIYLQPAGPNSIYLLWPKQQEELLSYSLPNQNLTMWFHPADFTQINVSINRQMIAQALALLKPQRQDQILDLFCGLGNFTLPIAQHCDDITGVEGDVNMVKRCQLNAERNQLSHVKFFAANLAEDFSNAVWAKRQYNKIILDPPRCGALEIVQMINQFAAKQILYISCNTATLARDAKELIRQGYRLTHAGIMDMFPHTGHVEAMALFKKDMRM